MSISLRPVLRPSALPSLPFATSSSAATQPTTTYICQSCRHARLLRRPKRPYTFSQLVTLSDGSAFMMRTTSPMPVYRSTRDTRNAPLWNPSSKELLNVEDDEAGRLAGFRARFGTQFDAVRETANDAPTLAAESLPKSTEIDEVQGSKAQTTTPTSKTTAAASASNKRDAPGGQEEWEQYGFEEDDANLLDLISSYGQQAPNQDHITKAPAPVPEPKNKKGKK